MVQYPIIIGGFYRSGTSLLRRLLDSHHHIYCGPEVKFFRDFYGNYLKDELAHLRLFSTIRTMGLNEKTLLEVFGKAFIECHSLAAKKAGKRRWADKNPENVLYLDQWHTLLEGELMFVNVIRNPLDALASLNEAGFKKTIPQEFVRKMALYKKYLEKTYAFIEKYPELSFTIRYEDLTINPRETLTELLSFLGESYDEAMLQEFFSHHRKAGIEDPKVAKTRSIHTQSIHRWKKDLSEEQIYECQKHLGLWMDKLNYHKGENNYDREISNSF